jgi:hypothetical protein
MMCAIWKFNGCSKHFGGKGAASQAGFDQQRAKRYLNGQGDLQ